MAGRGPAVGFEAWMGRRPGQARVGEVGARALSFGCVEAKRFGRRLFPKIAEGLTILISCELQKGR